MNVLLWHVHGSWTTSFVQGKHRYLVPVTPDRGPHGRGRARTYHWPDSVTEVSPARLSVEDIDVVVLQRPEELDLVAAWSGRRAGRDLPAIYLEHNTPKGNVPDTRHPMADRDDLRVVHVTHFNARFWDTGGTRADVVEHGIVPPRVRYTGDLARLAAVTNEPVRRWRVTGTDLLPGFAAQAPVDVFGMGVTGLADRLQLPAGHLATHEDLPQARMHAALAQRRAYLHLCRWTSLGLSLLEAMAIGLPVVALATTEAAAAVPPDAGIVSTNLDTLRDGARWLVEDPGAARRLGERGGRAVRDRYGLERFLTAWDQLLEDTCGSR